MMNFVFGIDMDGFVVDFICENVKNNLNGLVVVV